MSQLASQSAENLKSKESFTSETAGREVAENASLTKEQVHSLLYKLGTDDEFRQRYEAKPAAALVELGVPAEVVVNLRASCIVPKVLGDKEIYRSASLLLTNESAQRFASFMVPSVRLSYGA